MTHLAMACLLCVLPLSGCYSVDLTRAQGEAADAGQHLPTLPPGLPNTPTNVESVPDGGDVSDRPDQPDQPDPTKPHDDAGTVPRVDALPVLAVEAGGEHTCAIGTDGALRCWGANWVGQVGSEPAEGDGCTGAPDRLACVSTPRAVEGPVPPHTWASVSAGHTHTCAITTEGRLFCWGSNLYGELGNGSRTTDYWAATRTPVEVAAYDGFTAVAAGENHTCAIHHGMLLCWGRAEDGELGSAASPDHCHNDGACALTPQPLDDHDDWTAVVAAGQTTCGLRAGAIYCWGWSALNQQDLRCDHFPCTPSPVTRVGSDADWVNISTWASRTCAIKQDGSLWCWGGDEWGHARHPTPTRVELPGPVSDVATGEDHTCAITDDAALYCWGHDTDGEIGDGPGAPDVCDDFGCALHPIRIGQGYARVTAGYFHSCAQRLDGTLWCWGSNESGQLGSISNEQCVTGAQVAEPCATQPAAVSNTPS